MYATRYLPFVGRLMIGLPFAVSGLSKLSAYSAVSYTHLTLPTNREV